jgi:hypothetical protein
MGVMPAREMLNRLPQVTVQVIPSGLQQREFDKRNRADIEYAEPVHLPR